MRRARVALLAVVLRSMTAFADDGYEVFFPGPVLAGVPATLSFSLPPNYCPFPPCQLYHLEYNFSIDWGDGFSWYCDSEGYCPPGFYTHTYSTPGRYRLTISSQRRYAAECGDTLCSGHDDLIVDVAPNLTDGTLNIFFDQEATRCSEPVLPGTELFVVAKLGGATAGGIAATEFSIRVSASNAFTFGETAEPGWIKIGNALGSGALMAASCDLTSGLSQVAMLRIVAFPLDGGNDVQLTIQRSLSPSNPNYTTPIFTLCDAPFYTAIRANIGYSARLNPTEGSTGPCTSASTVAVRERTWTEVKSLYRDPTSAPIRSSR